MIRIDVQGDPVSQGSMSAIPFHRPCPKCRPGRPCGRTRMCVGGRELGANVVHSKEDEIRVWRGMIALAAKGALSAAGIRDRPAFPVDGVTLGVVFWMRRPQGHYTSKGNILSAEGERNPVPWKKPDADKLLRAVLDALTGEVYTDDAQVVTPIPGKRFGRSPGITILVDNRVGGFSAMATALDHLVDTVAPLPALGLFT